MITAQLARSYTDNSWNTEFIELCNRIVKAANDGKDAITAIYLINVSDKVITLLKEHGFTVGDLYEVKYVGSNESDFYFKISW